MTSKLCAAMVFACGGTFLSLQAQAAAPVDSIYIHCDSGGDFRISDLNHSVSQYSERARDYRPVCAECDITEWGNRITMKNGDYAFVQINRVTGFVLIQRSRIKDASAAPDISTFQGTCQRGTMVVAKPEKRSGGRAF